MPKLAYGFDVSSLESSDDDPWTKLDTINEHLEACEPIPPYLAQWLGLAIVNANRDANGGGDPSELLRRLGLTAGRGRKNHKHAPNAWSGVVRSAWQVGLSAASVVRCPANPALFRRVRSAAFILHPK